VQIVVEHLSKQYRGQVEALRGIDLSLHPSWRPSRDRPPGASCGMQTSRAVPMCYAVCWAISRKISANLNAVEFLDYMAAVKGIHASAARSASGRSPAARDY
jgi:hypothetical protein